MHFCRQNDSDIVYYGVRMRSAHLTEARYAGPDPGLVSRGPVLPVMAQAAADTGLRSVEIHLLTQREQHGLTPVRSEHLENMAICQRKYGKKYYVLKTESSLALQ